MGFRALCPSSMVMVPLAPGKFFVAASASRIALGSVLPALSTAPSATPVYRDANGNVVPAPVEGGTVSVAVSFQTLDMGLPFLPVPDHGNVTQEVTNRVENVPAVPLTC